MSPTEEPRFIELPDALGHIYGCFVASAVLFVPF